MTHEQAKDATLTACLHHTAWRTRQNVLTHVNALSRRFNFDHVIFLTHGALFYQQSKLTTPTRNDYHPPRSTVSLQLTVSICMY